MQMRLIFFFILIITIQNLEGQNLFSQQEEALAFDCDVMMHAYESRFRLQAHTNFKEKFLQVLHENGSYSYPFDSLKWISKLTPEDGAFRIFTWEISVSDSEHLQFGVIQTKDGRVFELKDHFRDAEDLLTEEFSPEFWLGATYYNLITVELPMNKRAYVLFGKNQWNNIEHIKIADVLFFSSEGKPFFGKPIFENEVNGEKKYFNRILLKYTADGFCSLNYNAGMEMIVFDHLIPIQSRLNPKVNSYASDGSYSGYTWNGKYWVLESKLKVEVLESAPRPKPVLNGKNVFGN